MSTTPVSRAASAAGTSLAAGVAILLVMIYAAVTREGLQPWVLVLCGLALATSIVVHLVFVGLLARRMGRSATSWVLLALLSWPIGPAAGLILHEWHTKVDQPPQTAA